MHRGQVQHHIGEGSFQLVCMTRGDSRFPRRVDQQGDLARTAGQIGEDCSIGVARGGGVVRLAHRPGQIGIARKDAAAREGRCPRQGGIELRSVVGRI